MTATTKPSAMIPIVANVGDSDMTRQLPQVNCRYGAPLGRRTRRDVSTFESVKLAMQRVPLNSGGYDSGGAYWGIGAPLYWYASDDGKIDGFVRAAGREAAKAEIRQTYPHARFYR